MTKLQSLSTLIEGTGTANRRHFIAASGMAALVGRSVVAQPETASPEAPSDATPDTDSVASHLMVGIPGFTYTDEMFSEVEIYDPGLEITGTVEVPDGVLSVDPTGNPNIALVNTIAASILFQMDTGSIVEIDWQEERTATELPQWITGSIGDEGRPRNPEWVVGSNVELTEVVAINTRTLVGRVITPYVNQTEQSVVPVLPRYNPNGSLMGMWTGDNVYLVDLEQPEDARRLYGDHPEWYSTTFDIDPTATWCTYTVYDPNSEDAAGEVLLENAASGEFVVVAEGTAWSQAQFIPGNSDEFIVIANGEVQVRRVDDPEAQGEHLADIGEQTHGDQIWDSSGTKFIQGTRDSDEAPERWLLIDLSQRSATELTDLEGLQPMMIVAATPAIDHVLFGLKADDQTGPATGFDFASGTTTEYLSDLHLGETWTYSASADGRWYYLQSENRGDTRGAWLLDLGQGEVYDLPWGDGEYTVGGAISSQGDKAAISIVSRPSDERTTYVIEPERPDSREPVGSGVVLGWS